MKKRVHAFLGIIGFVLLAASTILLIFFPFQGFYAIFCISFVLVLDFLDFKLRKKSLISNFMEKTHHLAVLIFFLGSIVFVMIIDFMYGVKIFNLWGWPGYTTTNWIILYTIINFCFIIFIYQTYQITRHFLSKEIREKHFSKIDRKKHPGIIATIFLLSLIFLIFPIVYFFLFGIRFAGFLMVLPFIGSWLICDSIIFMENRTPIVVKVVKKDWAVIFGILITSFSLSIIHEFVNKLSLEWKYLNIPFMNLHFFNIPVMVFLGWIPFTLFCISFLQLIKTIEWRTRKTL